MFKSKIQKIKKDLQKIVKSLFHSLFFLLYGRISSFIKHSETKNIQISNIEKDKIFYKIFTIINGRFYTDNVGDAAVIIENKIVDGPSYQLRSKPNDKSSPRNNANISENIVFKIGTPRFKKNVNGSILSLLSGGGANNNYFHWLYDVLPRLALFEQFQNFKKPDYILVPNNELNFQKTSLHLLGFQNKQILSSKSFRHFDYAKMYITDHPYNITNITEVDHEKIPSWISKWLKEKFLRENLKNSDFKRIYIDRDDIDPERNSNRRIINEVELRNMLEKLGFTFVKLKELSFNKQISIFHNAQIILGLHGAGFANLVFCKPTTKVIELRTKNTGKILQNIGLKNNLDFHALEYDPKMLSDNQNGLIEVDVEQIESLI